MRNFYKDHLEKTTAVSFLFDITLVITKLIIKLPAIKQKHNQPAKTSSTNKSAKKAKLMLFYSVFDLGSFVKQKNPHLNM